MIPKKIIVVEDEAITARYIEGIVQKQGSEVVGIFESFAKLVEAITELEVDLILMDINIIGPIDGIEASRRILQQYEIPIIFISAYNDNDTIEEVLKVAPYGFVSKPFTESDLLIAIKIGYGCYLSDTLASKESVKKELVEITDICYYHILEHRLYIHDKAVKLSSNQGKLLETLVHYKNVPVSQDQLVFSIWGNQEVSVSALRTVVYSLRKLLPDIPLETLSKSGYILRLKK